MGGGVEELFRPSGAAGGSRRCVVVGRYCEQLSGDLVEIDRAGLSRVTRTLCSTFVQSLGKKDVL